MPKFGIPLMIHLNLTVAFVSKMSQKNWLSPTTDWYIDALYFFETNTTLRFKWIINGIPNFSIEKTNVTFAIISPCSWQIVW